MSLRFHIEFTSSSLRFHFDFTSISLRIHFDLTLISLRIHFDFPSISLRFHMGEKGKRPATQGKRENSAGQKGKGKSPSQDLSSNSTWQPDRAHARTKRNDFPVGVTPQPPIYIYIYKCVVSILARETNNGAYLVCSCGQGKLLATIAVANPVGRAQHFASCAGLFAVA